MKTTKEELVDRILEQRTYSASSGLYRNLRASLWKMSMSDLSNLGTIIGLKIADAKMDSMTGSVPEALDILRHREPPYCRQ